MKAIIHAQVFDKDDFETFFDVDDREYNKLSEEWATSKIESEKWSIARSLGYYACIADYMAEDLSERGEIGQYLCKQLWKENGKPCSGFYEVDVTYHPDPYVDDDVNVDFDEKKLDLYVLEGYDENGTYVVGVVTADKIKDAEKVYSAIIPIDKTSHLFADSFANATFEDEEMQFVSDAVLEIVTEEKESQMTEEERMNQTIENASEEEIEDIEWE